MQLFMSCHTYAFVKDRDFDQQKSIIILHRLQLTRASDEALASKLDCVAHNIEEYLLKSSLIKRERRELLESRNVTLDSDFLLGDSK